MRSATLRLVLVVAALAGALWWSLVLGTLGPRCVRACQREPLCVRACRGIW